MAPSAIERTTPTAVVTGGTRGIGAGICERLVRDGFRVVVLARSAPPATEVPDEVQIVECDVAEEPQVTAAFEGIGSVDVLVNNAGISSSNPLGRTTLAEWTQNMAVNATGVFLCTRAVIGAMREADSGRIVTVNSTAGGWGAKYTTAYAASKHAAMGVMRVAAAEVEGSGVTANSVCPTFVRTPMTIETIKNIADKTSCDLVEAEARLAAATPHGRIIEIDEVVTAVAALIAGDDNGLEILLEGGPDTMALPG
jgi:NAD(P)-dependent dehydrogenase (short-subunit alcohol dehydrogenase family)